MVHDPVFCLAVIRSFSMASCRGQLDIKYRIAFFFLFFFVLHFSFFFQRWYFGIVAIVSAVICSHEEKGLICHVRKESLTISRILVLLKDSNNNDNKSKFVNGISHKCRTHSRICYLVAISLMERSKQQLGSFMNNELSPISEQLRVNTLH